MYPGANVLLQAQVGGGGGGTLTTSFVGQILATSTPYSRANFHTIFKIVQRNAEFLPKTQNFV